jgi:hypothetical protein
MKKKEREKKKRTEKNEVKEKRKNMFFSLSRAS